MDTNKLIKDCIKGKEEAQKSLYDLYASQMLGVCYRYTKSIEDAEDILQEGFIKVFTKINQFNNAGELGAWIRRIMVNTCINYLQKHSRYKNQLQLDDVILHPVSDQSPEIRLDTKQIAELIRGLSVANQTIFNLVAIEGYSHIEAADLLNMNVNTVRSQYKRARAILISKLEHFSDNEYKKTASGKI